MPDKQFLDTAKKTKQLCEVFNASLLIRNRADIAYLSSADGVNLEQEGLDIHSARELLGEDFIIGLYTNTRESVIQSVKDGADFIIVGYGKSTPTEPVIETGLEYAKWVSENTFLPVVVEGSIDIEFCQQLIDKNLSKLSVDNTILDTSSPHTVTVNLLEFLKK
jgi:thiamine-phosphate pyrophosphorylase